MCTELCLPLAAKKIEGPTLVLTFLGIELDTVKMICLPDENLVHLQQLVASGLDRKSATKRSLLSLIINQLAHPCKVVIPGRIFLRCMINLVASCLCLNHWIHLNQAFRSDLYWWHVFLNQ